MTEPDPNTPENPNSRNARRGFELGEVAAEYDDSIGPAVMELLPRSAPDNVSIGLAVAIDAMNDRNSKVAATALRLAADELEENNDW